MPLDFLGIGVQKGGTTSLHALLSRHPDLWLPRAKEVPFFTHPDRFRGGWARYEQSILRPPDDGRLTGKFTPHYMMGAPGAPTSEVAARVRRELPKVRLIALLRDPIDRAWSHWRMSVRRGLESRSFEAAVRDQLEGPEAEAGRTSPEECNSYVAQGEYGRILSSWLQHFPREQLHVEATADLATDGPGVSRRVQAFIGAPVRDLGEVPVEHRGGRATRLDRPALEELVGLVRTHVQPDQRTQRAFEYWLQQWNVAPEAGAPELSDGARARLENHFRTDARPLREAGIEVPS